MILLDATHTSHTRAQTGIQRVCRSLFAELELSGPTQAVAYDPHEHAWRTLHDGELSVLRDRRGAGKSRGAKWSVTQKLRGRMRRWSGRVSALEGADALICPEIFSPRVAARLPELFARIKGPRVAIFHDAIALKFPELTPPATVERMPGYLRELLAFDGIAAVSEDSARTLRDFWNWLGVENPPPVAAIPLGLDAIPVLPAVRPEATPVVLCVSTIEGRKNHLALLAAAEELWQQGVPFQLELIGMPRPDTAAGALRRIRDLQKSRRPLKFFGVVTDAELHAAYVRCSFTVYPSLAEGFGLPVLESLQHGRPCVCLGSGALGEAARGGGVRQLRSADAAEIGAALRDLLEHPEKISALTSEARSRKFRSWKDYAADLRGWISTLPRRG